MKLEITADNFELTEALKAFVVSKFTKIERHISRLSHVNGVHVVLSLGKNLQKAEIFLHLPKADVCASSEKPSMYNSIVDVIKKIDRQMLKHKQKMNNHG